MSSPSTFQQAVDVATPVDADAALNENWEWSDPVTDFVADELEGRSLKVCTGLRPICDVNLDALDLARHAADSDAADYHVNDQTGRIHPTEDAHPAIGGRLLQGDMLALPVADRVFETVVADPPWRGQSAADREQLFDECVRVCALGGKLIMNATWVPAHERARRRETRVRQQRDFWGCPSLLVLFRRTASGVELMDHYEYPVDDHHSAVIWSTCIDTEALTNPKAVDPAAIEYHCPQCGSTRLGQLSEAANPHDIYEFDLYECLNHECRYRISEALLEEQASEMASVDVEDLAAWKAYLESRGFETWVEYKDRGPPKPLADIAPVEEQRPAGTVRLQAFLD